MKNIVLNFALYLLSFSTLQAEQLQLKRIEPEGLPDHSFNTNLVTVQGNFKTLYVAGQVSIDKDLNCVGPGDWRAQYIQTMENVKLALEAGGATFSDVTYFRRYATDVNAFVKMFMDKENPIPDYFKGKLPASALIGVSGLADECYLMEFSAIAVVPAD